MRILIILTLFISVSFSMPVYEFTDSNVFNSMYSLFINLAVILVPLFGAIALARN